MRYWVVGEFGSGGEVLKALRRLRELGYARERLDAFSPYPVEGIAEVLELQPSGLRGAALVAGVGGAAFGYGVQWYTNAFDSPINAGNRPPHAAPAFLPITFEMMVLFAALTLFFGLMWLYRFPRPHHPLFELESFRSASTGGFWVSITTEKKAEVEPLLEHLRALEARNTAAVEEEA
jgi:hypothetical protein